MKRLTRQDFYAIIRNGIEGDKPQLYETQYYLNYFDQLGDRSRLMRWNWSAFFWDGAWLFYRRMFAYGSLVLAANIVLLSFLVKLLTNPDAVSPKLLIMAYAGIKIFWGIFGNVFYLTFIRRGLARGRVPGLVEGNVLWAYFGVAAILFIAGVL